MGALSNLLDGEQAYHMLFTPEEADLSLFVQDTLKATAGAMRDTVFRVAGKASFDGMVQMAQMPPMFGDKWVFQLDYEKIKAHKDKLFRLVTMPDVPAIFLFMVSNYGQFKEVKEALPLINDMYLASIRRNDVEHLLSGTSLPVDLIQFVGKSYYNNPDKVAQLRASLLMGNKFKTRAEIAEEIGVGTGTMKTYVFSLLGEPPKNAKSQRIVMKRRIEVGQQLCEMNTPFKLRNLMLGTIRDIRNIKILYLSGTIYKNIREIPEVYDVKRLSRYAWDLDRIKETPLSRIDTLLFLLEGTPKWSEDTDLLSFIYGLYAAKGVREA